VPDILDTGCPLLLDILDIGYPLLDILDIGCPLLDILDIGCPLMLDICGNTKRLSSVCAGDTEYTGEC
jgi:hypothetical protein